MKIQILLTISVFSILFFSCEEDDNNDPEKKNNIPVLSVISNITVTAGETENINIAATDVDGDSLTISISTNPGFLSISSFSQTGNNATATLIIETEKDNAGSYSVTIQVSDGKGGADREDFIITVIVPPYGISDIVGTWTGKAQSSDNNFSLTITIDSEGIASGTGAGGDFKFSDDEWAIDDKGDVTGEGAVVIRASGMITVQGGTWSLQLNEDKDMLTGEFYCDALGTMDIELSKQDGNEEPEVPPINGVTDYDGNIYDTVIIGTQVWMKENILATHYSDGTKIDSVFEHPNGSATYGRLYHWPAAMKNGTNQKAQGACPTGWHIPSKAEFDELVDFLGGAAIAGGKLKEAGTIHWESPNTGATNESKFTALPAGWNFYGTGTEANIWSSTENNSTQSYRLELSHDIAGINKYGESGGKNEALSVRCIKD